MTLAWASDPAYPLTGSPSVTKVGSWSEVCVQEAGV